jgi:hypothetical protein
MKERCSHSHCEVHAKVADEAQNDNGALLVPHFLVKENYIGRK